MPGEVTGANAGPDAPGFDPCFGAPATSPCARRRRRKFLGTGALVSRNRSKQRAQRQDAAGHGGRPHSGTGTTGLQHNRPAMHSQLYMNAREGSARRRTGNRAVDQEELLYPTTKRRAIRTWYTHKKLFPPVPARTTRCAPWQCPPQALNFLGRGLLRSQKRPPDCEW